MVATVIDENLYKKLYYLSTHRGCKESDIIFTNFVNKYILSLNNNELDLYINLLNESDLEILDWLSGIQTFPEKYLLLKDKLTTCNTYNNC